MILNILLSNPGQMNSGVVAAEAERTEEARRVEGTPVLDTPAEGILPVEGTLAEGTRPFRKIPAVGNLSVRQKLKKNPTCNSVNLT